MLRLVTLGRLELQREGTPPEAVVLQPKRLALLAYLALSPGATYLRRDLLLALFWPERNHAAARHALRHALYHLRNVLGDGVLVSRGSEEIGLSTRVWTDAWTFEEALQSGRSGDALRLYGGEFFAGVFVDGASPDWEEWVSRTRERLRTRAAAAAWTVAELAIRSGDIARGLDAARRARELDPDDEAGLQRLMRWLEHFGRRPAALRVFSDFARHIRGEYQIEPSPNTRALVEAIRESAKSGAAGAQHAPEPEPGQAQRRSPRRFPPRSPSGWRLRALARRRAARLRSAAGAATSIPGSAAAPVAGPKFGIESPR